jgi:hypothetical protein
MSNVETSSVLLLFEDKYVQNKGLHNFTHICDEAIDIGALVNTCPRYQWWYLPTSTMGRQREP